MAGVAPVHRYHWSVTLGANGSEQRPAFAVSGLPTASVPLMDGAEQSAAATGARTPPTASVASRTQSAFPPSFDPRDISDPRPGSVRPRRCPHNGEPSAGRSGALAMVRAR